MHRPFSLRGECRHDQRAATRPGHRPARLSARFVPTIVPCIGVVMAAFADCKHGLHDMIAGTLVVATR
jgi:hypothetical protein